MSSGNVIEFSRLGEGLIRYIAYDVNQDVTQANSIGTELSNYLRENSYGKNWLSMEVDPKCSDFVTLPHFEPETFPYIFRFPIYCPEVASPYEWIYRRIRHELGHMLGGSSGQVWDSTQRLSNEGDLYDPQGHFNQLTGHWAAPNKEVMGFIGPFGLRPFTLVSQSGTYVITNIESQSEGVKAAKIPKSRWTLVSNEDGTIIQEIRWFYYLELRSSHQFIFHKGKGKHPKATQEILPAVQIREGRPVYNPEQWYCEQRMRVDLGNNGGLGTGAVFSAEEIVMTQKQFDQPDPVVLSRRPFSVRAAAVDSISATLTVTYG